MISDRTKVRDGVVTDRAVYLAIGIDCDGHARRVARAGANGRPIRVSGKT
jgi:hypothetical protein